MQPCFAHRGTGVAISPDQRREPERLSIAFIPLCPPVSVSPAVCCDDFERPIPGAWTTLGPDRKAMAIWCVREARRCLAESAPLPPVTKASSHLVVLSHCAEETATSSPHGRPRRHAGGRRGRCGAPRPLPACRPLPPGREGRLVLSPCHGGCGRSRPADGIVTRLCLVQHREANRDSLLRRAFASAVGVVEREAQGQASRGGEVPATSQDAGGFRPRSEVAVESRVWLGVTDRRGVPDGDLGCRT
jgi:hypothetical protein